MFKLQIKTFHNTVILWSLLYLCGCSGFEFSPYDTHIPHEIINTNADNIQKIMELGLDSSYWFAVISDIHTSYDELSDGIRHINNRRDVAFTIITGDLTQTGMKDEYLQLYELLGSLNGPVVAVIGNHDYFNNGADIYDKLFGPRNFSCVVSHTKYIFFDSNFGAEGDNVHPDWLRAEASDTTETNRVLLFAHIAPWSFINPEDSVLKRHYLEVFDLPRLACSFFGHEHYFALYEAPFMCYSDCIAHRNYTLVSVTAQGIQL